MNTSVIVSKDGLNVSSYTLHDDEGTVLASMKTFADPGEERDQIDEVIIAQQKLVSDVIAKAAESRDALRKRRIELLISQGWSEEAAKEFMS